MNDHNLTRREFVRTSVAGALSLGALAAAASAGAKQRKPAGAPRPGNAPVDNSRAIFRADMSRCTPAAAFARDPAKDRWQLFDYETTEGVKGVMIFARPEDDCAALTLPLEVSGPHKVYLGINYTNSGYASDGQVDVRLSGDEGFRHVAAESGSLDDSGRRILPEGQDLFKSIQEAYWRTADLTGQSLVIRQPQGSYRAPREAGLANLAYVKLVPLTEAEKSAWQASLPDAGTRRLGLIYCTGGDFTGSTDGTPSYHPTDPQWFADAFAPFTGSDLGVFTFEALRGNYCVYRSRIGNIGPEDNRWREEWIDPLAEFTRLAHRHGLKIFAALRTIGPQYPMNREPLARASHYWRLQRFTKRDREGIPVSNLSLAYPEVRAYWLSLLRETLDYGTDGIQLHLNRSTPFVLYEEPVVRDFIAAHGDDPRKIPVSDPRWVAHCAGYVTQFVREVRALLDEKPGRQLAVTVFGPTKEHPEDKLYKLKSYACDVETWLREKLVDYVMPSQFIDPEALRHWREVGGDRVHLWPDMMPRSQTPAQYARLAKSYYAAGADGLCFWDGERRHVHISEWAAAGRLGHRDQLDRLIAEGESFYRSVPLKVIGGFSAADSFRDG